MITLIHGDDTKKVWEEYQNQLKKPDTKLEISLKNLSLEDVRAALSSTSLFGENKTIVITDLKSLHHTKRAELFNLLKDDKDTDAQIIILADTLLDTKVVSKIPTNSVYTFALPKYFFDYLDALIPSTNKKTLGYLANLKAQDGEQIFYATCSRVRALLLQKTKNPKQYEDSSKLSPFFENKLKSQSRMWDENKLKAFYLDLFSLECKLKTSSLPLKMHDHLDIMIHKHLK